ncbi:hypothetical protein [Nocardioides sp.]|uniref:hypothetical protein n=1 Tax=Nocardioides sp. TaxID=35761 RepID=UPI0035AF0425
MLRVVVASSAAVLALAGCAPTEPSPGDWRTTADQALEDTVSEVESVALVLDLQAHDRLPGRAARIAAVEAEESLATAEESLTTQQPPAGEAGTDRRLGDLLTEASDQVRQARIALTAGDDAAYADLRGRLLDLSDELDAAREDLR